MLASFLVVLMIKIVLRLKLKNVPTNLSNLKSKVDKLDVDYLVPIPADLSKLSDVVTK